MIKIGDFEISIVPKTSTDNFLDLPENRERNRNKDDIEHHISINDDDVQNSVLDDQEQVAADNLDASIREANNKLLNKNQ